jgi:hypothetical protein
VHLTKRFPSTGFLLMASLACGLSAAKPASAQTVSVSPAPDRKAGAASPTPGQKYDGVAPGAPGRNPLPSAPDGGAYLVWTGFQMTATGSQVFLQTTRAVEFDRGRSSRSTMAFLLRGCRIHMANNRRKIDTRYFATPVSSVSARQKGHDVEVRIALRETAATDPRNQAGPDGTQFVVLDFPPGKAAPDPSALQDLAASAERQAGTGLAGGEGDEAGSPRSKRAGRAGVKAAAQSSE